MVKLLTHAGRCTGRYLALAALTTTLVACGGGSGDSEIIEVGEKDFDNDGIPNGEDDDADGDNIIDTLDNFVDLDSDGFDDDIGDQDLDGDFIANKIDPDADGDGLDDFASVGGVRVDKFVDLNGDDLDDRSGFAEETQTSPCGSESGQDAVSANAAWNDNCLIKRRGQFADSLYTVGVQRVVYCSGFGDGASYTNFADGEFGMLTETALKTFQESTPDPIADDGQVGPRTWAKLESAITRLAQGQYVSNGDGGSTAQDSYGFDEGRCAGTPLFYQEVTLEPNDADQIATKGGWSLAKNTPNAAQMVPFSTATPFFRLD